MVGEGLVTGPAVSAGRTWSRGMSSQRSVRPRAIADGLHLLDLGHGRGPREHARGAGQALMWRRSGLD
jgi:hypothetical protein